MHCSKALLLLLLPPSAKHTNVNAGDVTVTHVVLRPASFEANANAGKKRDENKCKYILQSFRRMEHNETKMLLWQQQQQQLQSCRGQQGQPGRAQGLGLGLGFGLGLSLKLEVELGSKCTMRRTFWANEEKINKKHANISLANILTASLGPAHCPFGQPISNNFHTKMFLFILGISCWPESCCWSCLPLLPAA